MILDNIYNHYEKLVFDEVLAHQTTLGKKLDEDTLGDIVCVALNNLPARYVRHSVDIAFYLTTQEREQIGKLVHNAVKAAFELVAKNPNRE
jgi:competence protein ComFB